jgi:hypothetical protein
LVFPTYNRGCSLLSLVFPYGYQNCLWSIP